jgi:thioester reductase-like protein
MNRCRFEALPKCKELAPIAVIGIGCRFPGGVQDAGSFWNLLIDGRSGIREVPPDRWDLERYYHPDSSIPATMISKWGGFIDQVDQFDARFWALSPREAVRMDPQQRWLLEVAWEAVEDSGTPPRRIRASNTGVFVGIASHDYDQFSNSAQSDFYSNSGCTLSIAANRISYMLDLNGPSLAVDTACSSSLVAVWLACRNIWSGCCQAALAGGVNALLSPGPTLGFSKASMLSPTGQCFAFDARANGYVRGEGAGIVYLKPLEQALADHDRIYAVIRSAVSNQDGHTSSMLVPGLEGQTAMLRQAYQLAGFSPSRVVYMEAHGTGTPVGDPIEAKALGRVLSEGRPANQPCLMGSVKTNIGHLEAGSGIAGMIKAALVLHHDTVPPSLNYEKPNPNIPFGALGLKVADRLQSLPHWGGLPPVAAVNSFGFGGSNAHVVLEQAPPAQLQRRVEKPVQRPYLLPISAKDAQALRHYVEAYRELLAETSLDIADVCYSAGERKEHHDHRLVALGRDAAELRKRLGAWLRSSGPVDGIMVGRARTTVPSLVFVYTGQGAQWWAMGRQLLEREPVFRRTVQEINDLLQPLTGWSLREEMARAETESRIDQTDIAQPAIFALQVALTELWKSWGVQPTKVIGHSVGEVAAAHRAGIYSLRDAVHIIYHRSRLQNTTSGNGRMLAAGISVAEARQLIGPDAGFVEIAVLNSPNLVTLSGDTKPLERIAECLEKAGKFTRWLRIQYAFHTHQMDPIKDELLQALADIEPLHAQIPFISTVTGSALAGEQIDGDYWWRNVRQPVLFAPAIIGLLQNKDDAFVEVGPHPALASSIQECMKESGVEGVILHSLSRKTDESAEILSNLAALHLQGVSINWAGVNQSAGNLVRLPNYPWNRESFWLESLQMRHDRFARPEHPLLGLRMPAVKPTWEVTLYPQHFPYLNDHRFWDTIVFPGAGFAEMGMAVARLLFSGEPYAVEDLEIKKALFINPDHPPVVQIIFDPESKSFSVHSSNAEKEKWELHAQGRLTKMAPAEPQVVDLNEIRGRLSDHFDHTAYYKDFELAGYQFGPNFREVQNIWRTRRESLSEIIAPPEVTQATSLYHMHPAVLDATFHLFKAFKVSSDRMPGENFYLPQSFRRVHLHIANPPGHLWAHGKLIFDDGKSMIADIFVFDNNGRRIADVLGLRLDRAEQKRAADDIENCYYAYHWEARRLHGQGIQGDCAFPSASEITAAARTNADENSRQHELDQYAPFAQRVDSLVCQSVQNALLQLGWRPSVGERFRAQVLIDRLGIVEPYPRLARAHFRHLAKHGLLLSCGPDEWEVRKAPKVSDLKSPWQALSEEYPRFASETALHQRLSPQLSEVMCGKADPVELIFPGGSFEFVEQFYTQGFDFPAHQRLVGDAVDRLVQSLPARRILRVLEIGAGTGSFTRLVLPHLPADRTDYLFTDITTAFLASAKNRFADFPFVEYHTFDIEKDPVAQGINLQGYDLILGSLVIHATTDLKQTLANLRSCLAPGGMLFFLEWFPGRHAWDTVFGLLSGWWRFSDTALRPDSLLLNRAQWLHLLMECGFRDAGSFGTWADERESETAFFYAFEPTAEKAPLAADNNSTNSSSRYVVFADRGGVAGRLAAKLKQRGAQTISLRAGSDFKRISDSEFRVDANSEEDLRRVLAEVGTSAADLAGIIHCWSLDHPRSDGLLPAQLQTAQETGVLSALRLLHVLSSSMPANVWFLTRGVYHAGDNDPATGLASAPIVGLARVANNEYFPNRFAVIDLDVPPDALEIDDLAQEFTAADGELEIAYRAGRRHVHRLNRVRADELPVRTFNAVRPNGDVTPFRLQTTKPGILTNLALSETVREEPGPEEIEIRVRAGGINFRDVMKALGTYPGNPIDLLWFGDDVAGVVERVGAKVRHLRPGDEVVGMVPYCFRTFVTADARMVFRKPPGMTFEQAATLPTVFLTAHYAINHLAQMEAGESILIHAGTGGVGQAAIQIAKHLGLTIFATAGTPDKRQMLLDQGVHHVLNSRTLEFADQIMEITQGRGVDAVLNSLAGDFIPKSMSVLAPFGRFLEIGKIDIYRNSKIGLEALRNNISYFVIDLAQHLERKPALVARMFQELGERFAAGDYAPLPHTVFPITKAFDAFRYMAQGKHVGKNVLSFNEKAITVGPCTEDGHRFRANATYLITGGAGGFGLEVAKWMVRQGARNVLLFSRSGPRDEAVLRDIEQMRAAGVNVLDERGDVTRLEDVVGVVKKIGKELPPLRGIVHAAMVLDDDAIVNLDEKRFCDVMHPKMLGAWNLHTATAGIELEHFVCFSSISSVAGAPKQSNYNAGNFFLETLAGHRRAAGLPALTINWGALLGAGYVERNRRTAEFLDKIGTKAFQLEEALRILERVTPLDCIQFVAARLDWRAAATAIPNLARSNTFAAVARDSLEGERGGSLLARLQGASSEVRPALVEEFIASQVAGVFGVTPEKITRDAPLTSLGLDSLMAVELTNRIEREVGVTIPMGNLLGGPSIKALSTNLLQLVASSLQENRSAAPAADSETEIDHISEWRLEPEISPPVGVPRDASKPDRALLTGATGFLGAFLLDELLRATDAEVVCLVRAPDVQQGRLRIVQNLERYGLDANARLGRIIPLLGDLEQPLLGLDPKEFDRLAGEIDAIYHNGAIVNLIYPYSQLRAANVLGTREVLRLATRTRPKTMHYVSTFMVLAGAGTHAQGIVTEEDGLPAWETLPDGYTRSKWVAEKMVEEARSRGLPVTIFRPGHITGHSRTGVCNAQDFFHTLILACWQIGSAPNLKDGMDVTPVDFVSQAIVQLSRRPECLGGTYHLVNPHPLRLPVLLDWLESQGVAVETVPFPVWRDRLTNVANGSSPDLLAPLLNLIAPQNGLADDELRWHPRFDCRNATSRLAENGIVCPRADDQLLRVYCNHLHSTGRTPDNGNGATNGTASQSTPVPAS